MHLQGAQHTRALCVTSMVAVVAAVHKGRIDVRDPTKWRTWTWKHYVDAAEARPDNAHLVRAVLVAEGLAGAPDWGWWRLWLGSNNGQGAKVEKSHQDHDPERQPRLRVVGIGL